MRFRERFSLVVAVVALVATAVIAGSASGRTDSGQKLPSTVKVGAPLDLSGSAAIALVGTDEQKGEQLAVDEINAKHFLGKTKLSLNVVDTQAAKDVAVQTVIDMTRTNKVDAIVGFTLTPSFLAAGPMAQQAQVPTIAVGLSGTGVTETGNFIFRVYPALVAFYKKNDPTILKALGAKNLAYFSDSDSSNIVEQHAYRKKLFESLGYKTVADETTTSDAIDYQAQLTKIKNAKPDVLIVNLNGGQDPTFAAQLEQTGLKVPMMTDLGFGAPSLATNPGAQCAIFTTTWDSSIKDGRNPHFIKAFQDKYGKPASQYAAWGYDGIYILAYGLRSAQSTDHVKLRRALVKLKNVQGALGKYDIGGNRTPDQAGVIFVIKDNKFQRWTPKTKCTK